MSSAPWFALVSALVLAACDSAESGSTGVDSGPDGTGGAATGGSGGASSGGATAASGGASSGGRTSNTGGISASGGSLSASGGRGSGGSAGSGGSTSSGGAAASGGSTSSGGAAGTGGTPVVLPEGKGWLELANTKIASVCACNDGFPELCANSGCSGIFAWSSGAYDTKRARLIVFGGGHSDYFGNELFALTLADRKMSRITDPGLPRSTDCSPAIAGGTQPNSRHTYDALVYVEHADRLFVFGGSKAPCGYLGDDAWAYSFADSKWERKSPSGPIPKGVPGIVADYDPVSKKVIVHDDSAVYSYDLDADRFELLKENVSIDYHLSGVVDVAHRKFVVVGSGNTYVYDMNAGYSRTDLKTTGGDAIVGSGYPGLAYDPAEGGRIVAWNGGASVYALDLDTAAWTAYTSQNGPGDANGTGTYKRFRLVESGTFVLVNAHDQNAFLFRM